MAFGKACDDFIAEVVVNSSSQLRVVVIHRAPGVQHKPVTGTFPPTLECFWCQCVTHPHAVMSSVQVSNIIPAKYNLSHSALLHGVTCFALQMWVLEQGVLRQGSVHVRMRSCCFLMYFPCAQMLGVAQKVNPAPNCPDCQYVWEELPGAPQVASMVLH